MQDGTEMPPKHQVAESLLNEGAIFVHFDPRFDGVVAPLHLKDQPQLVLQFGYGLAVPIPDLFLDEEGISGTLSFQRTPHACFVPWPAVFAIVGEDGRGLIFPESMPPEIHAEVEREARRREMLSVIPEAPEDEREAFGGSAREPLIGETLRAGEPETGTRNEDGDEDGDEDATPDNVIHVAFGRKAPPEGDPPKPPSGTAPPSLRRIK